MTVIQNGSAFQGAPQLSDSDKAIVDAYARIGRTLDDLPYTPDFEELFDAVKGAAVWHSRWELLHRLQNLRKAGKLPRLGRAESSAVRVDDDEHQILLELVLQQIGTLGQRDQLLYDPKFDALVQSFNARTSRSLTPHDVWRLVAKLAK